ncbi:MAG: hypothetical protein NWF05_05450 [Candidatus Bathyarchaeota archaeon]|nr:hypothetical protein [Candidatus Bathyarchaeota archaeon]
MTRRGPEKGSKYCDMVLLLKFLEFIKRDQPTNVYRIYHSQLRFDTKKIYRYLRYALKLELVKLAYVEEERFLPAKFYELTPLGTSLLNVGIEHTPKVTQDWRQKT